MALGAARAGSVEGVDDGADDARLGMLARVTAAFAVEIDQRGPDAAIPWPLWPDAAALVDHLGRNHLWASGIVRTGGPVDRQTLSHAPRPGARGWYTECRDELLATLAEVPRDRACWTIGGRPGTASFWTRRMLYETTKHLIDLRAAGGGAWTAAPELAPVDYADAVDELFTVFLTRSAPGLEPLPSPLVLRMTDAPRSWRLGTDWTVTADPDPLAVTLSARAADLALALWERADPLAADGRFTIEGDPEVVRALATAPIHP